MVYILARFIPHRGHCHLPHQWLPLAHTCQTRPTGKGFWRVWKSQPLPVPVHTLTCNPCGFGNLCVSLQTVVSHWDESENLNYLVDTRLNLLVRDTCPFGAWDTHLDLVSTPMTPHPNCYWSSALINGYASWSFLNSKRLVVNSSMDFWLMVK